MAALPLHVLLRVNFDLKPINLEGIESQTRKLQILNTIRSAFACLLIYTFAIAYI